MAIPLDPLTPNASAIWKAHRRPACTLCTLASHCRTPNIHGDGMVPARGMLVGDVSGIADDQDGRPLRGTAGEYLRHVIRDADIDWYSLYHTVGVKCAPPRDNRQTLIAKAQKACAPYLENEIRIVKPKVILSMGAVPFWQLTKKTGITTNRGQLIELDGGITLLPTLSPHQVLQLPHLMPLFEADIRQFGRILRGVDETPKVHILTVRSLDDLGVMVRELEADEGKMQTWDVETRGFVDYRPGYSRMWVVAFTRGKRDPDGSIRVWGVPLEHPDSPFLLDEERRWPQEWVASESEEMREVVNTVVRLSLSNNVNNHNAKFDLRNMISLANRYGIDWEKFLG